jgi:hypothetical protein
MGSPLSNFIRDYSFYRIQSSKTILLLYYNIKTKRHYIKSKEAFIEEIYDISLTYNTQELNIIQEIRSRIETRKENEPQIVYEYLLKINAFKKVENIKFKPIDKKEFSEEDLLFFNEFRPTKYLKKEFNNGCNDPNLFPTHKHLIMNLCANDQKAYEYTLKVLSHSIKEPETKRHGYLVFQGKQASGKGSFNDLILEPIFKEYFVEEDETGIGGRFNSESYNKIWIVINEKEGTDISSIIKRLTGSSTGTSEKKGQDRQKVEDYRNIIICTNETDLGLGLKQDDRRATILGYSKPLGGSKEKAPKTRKWLEKEIPKERDNFVSYLKNLDFDVSEIFSSYETKAREQLIGISMNNIELFIYEIKNYENESLYLFLEDIEFEKSLINFLSHKNKTWIRIDHIYKIFEKFCKVKERTTNKINKFCPEFYNITGLEPTIIKKEGHGKLKYINLKEFLKYFKLDMNPTTKPYIKESINKTYSKNELKEITINSLEVRK